MSEPAPIPQFTLNSGHAIPAVGFGTIPLRGPECYAAVRSALDSGYRLIDAAANYHNEGEVGRALREFIDETGASRADVVVQTKVPSRLHGRGATELAIADSLDLLGLDHIDVVLLHAPDPLTRTYPDSWDALSAMRDTGRVRSVGVSNCSAEIITELADISGVIPAVHQLELNTYLAQETMRALHAQHGILTQAWNPLGGAASAYIEPPWADVARGHGVSTDQVKMRWHFQLGNVALPVSNKVPKQRDLLDIFGFELTDDEMARVGATSQPPAVDPWTVGDGTHAGW